VAELLLELLSEEIPARLQRRAEDDLKRLLAEALKERQLGSTAIRTYSTPRRLAAVIEGLPKTQPDVVEERRGPRPDAAPQAIEGFLKSTGLTRSQLEERNDPKGAFLYAVVHKKGRATADVMAEGLPSLIARFPWPKSMTWGEGTLRWIRPLQSILCLFDGAVVPFAVDGLASGDTTEGHRFLSGKTFAVKNFQDYKHKLNKNYVLLDATGREHVIHQQAAKLARKKGLTVVEDPALLSEVAGLNEWPVALLGSFDPAFLDVPEEVLVAVMRYHQKFFSLRKGTKLAACFISVANTKTVDGGKAVVKGNERVLAARLSDARFFWEQDVKIPLAEQAKRLSGVVFHQKLGTVADRVTRIEAVAAKIAPLVPGCDAKALARGAALCKADLVTGMVGEFPELQGIMGGHYAKAQGEGTAVAEAIRGHYSPRGPSDPTPKAPVSVALALADKVELLSAMFGADEKPTGSKDPFALRRAALGAIRLIVENNLRIGLYKDLGFSDELVAFFEDRLKVQQREQGVRHDLIEAVFSTGGEDDLVRLLARVKALENFLKTPDGVNLLAGYKRALSIVAIEEKKDGKSYAGAFQANSQAEPAEQVLFDALQSAKEKIKTALAGENFVAGMKAVAALRAPVDSFFDNVRVNVEDLGVRENRLRLLAGIREGLKPVADFSKIEG
jgi:glycyl-tRNA synthetase beta chain